VYNHTQILVKQGTKVQVSKDYERHGGTFSVSYEVPPHYKYDAKYTEYAYQDATRQMSSQLYELLMRTKQPAVVELNEHADEVWGNYDGERVARLVITARVTPCQTRHVTMISYEPMTMTPHPYTLSIRKAVAYQVKCVWQQLKYNWQKK
jgi:hypothetical protein